MNVSTLHSKLMIVRIRVLKCSSSDVTETSIESDVNEVDPLTPHDEEVDFLLKGRESSHFK